VLLAGQAIAGAVVRSDAEGRELINGRYCKRSGVTLRTDEPCMIPLGAEVWWTKMPNGREWLVTRVAANSRGSDVELVLQTNRTSDVGLPAVRDRACFSEFNTREGYEVHLPQQIPWAHQPTESTPTETDLEGSEAA
jgi:hypothetical protein